MLKKLKQLFKTLLKPKSKQTQGQPTVPVVVKPKNDQVRIALPSKVRRNDNDDNLSDPLNPLNPIGFASPISPLNPINNLATGSSHCSASHSSDSSYSDSSYDSGSSSDSVSCSD